MLLVKDNSTEKPVFPLRCTNVQLHFALAGLYRIVPFDMVVPGGGLLKVGQKQQLIYSCSVKANHEAIRNATDFITEKLCLNTEPILKGLVTAHDSRNLEKAYIQELWYSAKNVADIFPRSALPEITAAGIAESMLVDKVCGDYTFALRKPVRLERTETYTDGMQELTIFGSLQEPSIVYDNL